MPPYHIAGVGAALTNLYAGRKMVYLPNFDAQEWVRLVNAEHVTTATLVPTMLDRVITVLETAAPLSCRRCATWPTAARRWACRWSDGRWNCCRAWGSSTPTG